MSVAEAKYPFVICSTLLTVALIMGGTMAMKQYFPEHYPVLYPAIPIFFYLYELAFNYVYKAFPEKRLYIQMIGKAVKLILSIVLVLGYAFIIKSHVKAFIICFFCCYVIYLIFESCFFLKLEMDIKNQKKK